MIIGSESILSPAEKANNDMTVSDLFEAWLTDVKKPKETYKPRVYFLYYISYLEKSFGNRRVNDITYDEWQDFKRKLSSPGDTWSSEMTAGISKRAFRAFGKAFEYGKHQFGLNDPNDRNPKPLGEFVPTRHHENSIWAAPKAAPIIPNDLVFSSKITDVFTDEETEKMKSSLIHYNSTHISVMLCLFAGLSQSEICGLQWQDIDTDNKTVQINRIYLRKYTGENNAFTALTTGSPRGMNGKRTVPIPEWLAEMLTPLKRFYEGEVQVLTGEKKPVGPATFCYNYYPRFLDWAGVQQKPFTALRNTFVRMCFDRGIDVKRITLMLGGTNLDTTIKKYFEKK